MAMVNMFPAILAIFAEESVYSDYSSYPLIIIILDTLGSQAEATVVMFLQHLSISGRATNIESGHIEYFTIRWKTLYAGREGRLLEVAVPSFVVASSLAEPFRC